METKICSKCGEELPLSEFHKNGFDAHGNTKYRGYCKKCAIKKETERYQQKKQYINKQKIQCAKCGETRIYTLDFHHKDESKKEFNIGRLKKGSLEVIQKEINKCIVLCSNCHREFHYFANQNNMILEEYLSNNTPS